MKDSNPTTSFFTIGILAGLALTIPPLVTFCYLTAAADQKKEKKAAAAAADVVVRAPGGKAWRMSKYVKHNGILRTQGLCGDFSKMPKSSTGQQTAEALEKLDDILKEAGLERKNLIAMTIFIADISHDNFEEMNAVYDKWVDPDGLPTRLCVQAKIGHDAAVEFRAEAYYIE